MRGALSAGPSHVGDLSPFRGDALSTSPTSARHCAAWLWALSLLGPQAPSPGAPLCRLQPVLLASQGPARTPPPFAALRGRLRELQSPGRNPVRMCPRLRAQSSHLLSRPWGRSLTVRGRPWSCPSSPGSSAPRDGPWLPTLPWASASKSPPSWDHTIQPLLSGMRCALRAFHARSIFSANVGCSQPISPLRGRGSGRSVTCPRPQQERTAAGSEPRAA